MGRRRSLQPPEDEFQSVVCQYAEMRGWSWWHFHDSRRAVPDGKGGTKLIGDRDAAGWPDLSLAHSRFGIILAEVKGPSTRITPDQLRSLDALSAAVIGAVPRGMKVHVWRPKDWDHVVKPSLDGTYRERFYGW